MRATAWPKGRRRSRSPGGRTAPCSCWSRCADGAWVLGIPDGGGAGPLLAQLEDRIYGYALVVEPAQVWAVLPAPTGAAARRPHHRRTGRAAGRGCEPQLDVRNLYSRARAAR